MADMALHEPTSESTQSGAAVADSSSTRIYKTTYDGRTEVDVDKLLDRQQDFLREVSHIIQDLLARKSAPSHPDE